MVYYSILNIAPCVTSFFFFTFSPPGFFLVSFWFLLLTPHSQSLFFHSLPSSISTPFPAFWTLFSCCFLCLECHPPKLQCQLLCLFRVFWKAWWRQISHSVIQALCIAWGLFCISNVIRKSLTQKWSPLQHPHLEMSSICYKSPQFRTNDFTQNLAKSYRKIQDGALGRSVTKNCPNLSTFSRWCFLVASSSVSIWLRSITQLHCR